MSESSAEIPFLKKIKEKIGRRNQQPTKSSPEDQEYRFTTQEVKTPRLEKTYKGFLPIEETEYLKKDLADKDPTRARIQALLADVTYPLSIIPVIREPYEKFTEKDASYLDAKSKEERIKWLVNGEIENLQNTGTMLKLRDEAQALDTEFQNSHISPDSDGELKYLRKATELHAKMHAYVKNYLEYKSGKKQIASLEADTSQILQQIQGEVETIVKMQRDKQDVSHTQSIMAEVTLPLEKHENATWDREEIRVSVAQDDKITGVSFDERYDHTVYCSDLIELTKAYRDGKRMSLSEIKSLADYGYIDTSEFDKVKENTAGTILTVPRSEKINIEPSPMFIFPYVLPSELAEKIKGRSLGNAYSTGTKEVGPLQINTRFHDFGDWQYVVNLDTRNLSNEEVWKLVGTYVDTLKAFPRIQKNS